MQRDFGIALIEMVLALTSLFALCCGFPLILIGGLILLVLILRRGRGGSAQPTPASPEPPADDAAQKLKQLKGLLEQELITEAEYEAKKAEILAEM